MPNPIPNCRIEPVGDYQFSFLLYETEVLRWCFSPSVPRPYFYPVKGPSRISLTRMGHPGAPNHDHHRSLWFAHNDLMGQDFWSENKPARIVQKQWYAIEDSDDFARIGFELHWLDGHEPQPLATQNLFVTLSPVDDEWTIELQSDFLSAGDSVAFHKNNFGILGVRLAKSLSAVFGSGIVTGSNGLTGESALFGQANRWLDYSGPVSNAPDGNHVTEGLCVIDHRSNIGHPTKWHVRDDGWIGPSLSRDGDVVIPNKTALTPLTVRQLIYVHRGAPDAARIGKIADAFDQRPALSIVKGTRPHHQWEFIELASNGI